MSPALFRLLANVCFIGGFSSIIGSIAVWFLFRSPDPAYAERLGIFVGLWAPTFFILSERFERSSLVVKR
jgi:hypothetical protein